MTFEDLKQKYAERGVAFPENWPKPNTEDLNFLIQQYKAQFPTSFIDFQLNWCQEVSIGDNAFEGFGWANKILEPYLNLEEVLKDYQAYGFPDFLTPFRQDNGDFWCFDNRVETEEYPVVVWDHNSNQIEKDPNYSWSNFIDWLDKTMNEEY